MSNAGLIEEINLRTDLINGNFPLDAETIAYMRFAREEIEKVARALNEKRPESFHSGRYIEAIARLQEAKNLFCDAVILGSESKRRKTQLQVEPKPSE